MAITNNDITQKQYKNLSIQVALNGLSFCVIDTHTHSIIAHNSVVFDSHKVLDESLFKAFLENPLLSKKYDAITILHDNNLNTFVPKTLVNKENLGAYLQYNIKVFETDFFVIDEMQNLEMCNIHVPFVSINNFFIDQFQSFEYKNTNTILVEKLIENESQTNEKQVFVHLQKHHFEIVILQNKNLLLFNSFEYNTKEDFIYYVLFTLEQLQLNPETITLQFLGNVTENDAIFAIAYKYIRNCTLLLTENSAKNIKVTPEEMRQHYILFHS